MVQSLSFKLIVAYLIKKFVTSMKLRHPLTYYIHKIHPLEPVLDLLNLFYALTLFLSHPF
jgi:hypothetical protein